MKRQIVVLFLVLGILTGCTLVDSPALPEDEFSEGLAAVEDVEVVMLMSFPLQVHLKVQGYLPNPCTEIGEIQTERDGYAFGVTIPTLRDPGVDCIQVIEDFEINIPLDVYGLPAGDYQVVVNGVETGFSFTQDNILGE
jgi:inhibitor of cysteine peptidase